MPELAGDSGSAGITCCAALLAPEAGGSDKASEGLLLLVLSGASAGAMGDIQMDLLNMKLTGSFPRFLNCKKTSKKSGKTVDRMKSKC